ncbi:MAG: GAF and ANTAR domain-containing protein [Acidobacteria bacterium]|nr:GAF and ANTAR domain-containing protein [Acidobacteriota bacterium]
MTDQNREAKLSRAFVTLADTLVADFDLIDLLQTLVDTCTEVLDTEAAGLLLKTSTDELQVVVSTTEDAEFVELVQLGAHSGPCVECVTTGKPVTVADIDATGDRWPDFREAALQRGFRSLQATPLRLRGDIIGTMNLLDTRVGALNEQDVAVAQALSDVATIGILAERAAREHELLSSQLQGALDSRIVIEQAKGALAQSTGLSMDGAFTSIRSYARSNNMTLRAVAAAVVERRLDVSRVVAASTMRKEGSARRGSSTR